MATDRMRPVLRHLRGITLRRDGAGLTDAQLLSWFVDQRDEAAFAALVRRHGPMVWGVSRRMLSSHHDAEDAFQATFLVLVRKAATVVPREMLPNWLYGVAHQTALKARATAARRRGRERQVTQLPEPCAAETGAAPDWQSLIDRALSLLPDKYRVAIVLCDLEGKTRREAARQLSIPEGTLAARLARGRVMLAKRMAKQGLNLSGGAVAVLLSETAASPSVPTAVVSSTIKAATLIAAGQAASAGVISAKVAALTEGVLKAMLLTKLKITLIVLAAVGTIGAGAGMLRHSALGAAQTPEIQKDLEQQLQKARQALLEQQIEQQRRQELERAAIARRLAALRETQQAEIDRLIRDLETIAQQLQDKNQIDGLVKKLEGIATKLKDKAKGATPKPVDPKQIDLEAAIEERLLREAAIKALEAKAAKEKEDEAIKQNADAIRRRLQEERIERLRKELDDAIRKLQKDQDPRPEELQINYHRPGILNAPTIGAGTMALAMNGRALRKMTAL